MKLEKEKEKKKNFELTQLNKKTIITEFHHHLIQMSKDEATDAHCIYWILNAITSKNLSQIFGVVQYLFGFAILQEVVVIWKLSLGGW